MTERQYDVVLYGASGFTGRQTVQYFAHNTRPSEVRWAIAGRNRQALEAARAQAGEGARASDILIADAQDQQAVDAIVSKTRILLTTAGPFSLYGSKIVDACVRFKTHYVDITGETFWVRDLIDRYHARAAADGTRIIPCCGFDSIPSDLGTYLVARHVQAELRADCREVKSFYQIRGGLNGGTFASTSNAQASGRAAQMREPFLLNPSEAHTREENKLDRDPRKARFDSDIGAWCTPFIMGVANTRIVRRSAGLFEQWHEPYGREFHYQEYQKITGPMARAKAYGMLAALGMLQATLKSPAGRRFLKRLAPKPGRGPSQQTMDNGFFRCDLVGIAADSRKVYGVVSDKGDPGNRATVKFLCESALSLALNADQLPGAPQRGGVLTPATGLGDVLVERLRKAGMRLETSEHGPFNGAAV
ncbi:MAG TPA: saccharopine dehydrogenase NADP-binding domain-containing protein [Candidatus Dormibacteraeota bacterium]|nr:saccharopine dehydrogenase NADP-binding domain-containing protein [Candidatus Dormibacteraeota bacterium]